MFEHVQACITICPFYASNNFEVTAIPIYGKIAGYLVSAMTFEKNFMTNVVADGFKYNENVTRTVVLIYMIDDETTYPSGQALYVRGQPTYVID